MSKRLGIGIVGSGFNAKFHMLGFVGVRDADILGVWSPNQQNAAGTAGVAKKLGVGEAKPYPSIAAMVEDPAIDANLLWGRGAKLTGRPYLARAAEEHSGPHGPWFWQGSLQGGGVLNDMMCHSSLLVQHLLTDPTKPRS